MISPCGINCETCPAYLVSISGDMEEKKKLAKEWSNTDCEFEPEEIYCTGCLSSDWKMTKECKTRACIQSKDYTSCAQCDTYPCPRCAKNDNIDSIRESIK